MEYIPKFAVVAEIERLMTPECSYSMNKLLDNLDSLEVKEVDLNEEIEKCLKRHSMLAVGKKDFTDIAKHFFVLGMSVSKK